MGDLPDIDFKPSPYPDSSEKHRIWCAVQYGLMIGEYREALTLAARHGQRVLG